MNADQLKRWVDEHAAYLQRIAEDTKYEKRWPHRVRRNINEARETRCRKHHDRIDTWNHTATAMIAGLAIRRKVASVTFDHSCRAFLPEYPYHDFVSKLTYKLEEYGIELKEIKPSDASGEVVDENATIEAISETR